MTHAILDDLEWRYTTKKYDANKKVSQADLAILLEALRLSASSINSQPWKFIVLESDEAKLRMHKTFINKYAFNQPHVLDASHVILFAHNPHYDREHYEAVVDKGIADKRTPLEKKESAFAAFHFAELNTDEEGSTESWTKAQTYLALGNALHVLARLKIDSTTMEGIDVDLVETEFSKELDGHHCHVALAIGYRKEDADYNCALSKSRLPMDAVITTL